jgi:hypothetical protein
MFLVECTNADEVCSITMEPMAQTPAMPGVSKDTVPLAKYPHLTTAELECGHRFNAMALIVHFARNSMQCPLCRAGAPDAKLALHQSFPQEPWIPELEIGLLSVSLPSDSVLFRLDGLLVPSLANILTDVMQIPLFATIWLHGRAATSSNEEDPPSDNNDALAPLLALECRLTPTHDFWQRVHNGGVSYPYLETGPPSLRPQYELPHLFVNTFKELLEDIQPNAFSLDVFAMREDYMVHLTTSERLSYHQLQPEVTTLQGDTLLFSAPPNYQQRHTHSLTPSLCNLLYTPCDRSILSMLLR